MDKEYECIGKNKCSEHCSDFWDEEEKNNPFNTLLGNFRLAIEKKIDFKYVDPGVEMLISLDKDINKAEKAIKDFFLKEIEKAKKNQEPIFLSPRESKLYDLVNNLRREKWKIDVSDLHPLEQMVGGNLSDLQLQNIQSLLRSQTIKTTKKCSNTIDEFFEQKIKDLSEIKMGDFERGVIGKIINLLDQVKDNLKKKF